MLSASEAPSVLYAQLCKFFRSRFSRATPSLVEYQRCRGGLPLWSHKTHHMQGRTDLLRALPGNGAALVSIVEDFQEKF